MGQGDPANADAVQLILDTMLDICRDYYSKRYQSHFTRASTVTNIISADASNEFRNAFDHTVTALEDICSLYSANERSIKELSDRAHVQVERTRRHIAAAIFYTVLHIIDQRLKHIPELIDEAEGIKNQKKGRARSRMNKSLNGLKSELALLSARAAAIPRFPNDPETLTHIMRDIREIERVTIVAEGVENDCHIVYEKVKDLSKPRK
jgi:hypothetical protein